MEYQDYLKKIQETDWPGLNPYHVVLVSWATADEFASSLRCAEKVYPDSEAVRNIALGELDTDNLTYDSYTKRGDHFDFLDHFKKQHPHLRDLLETNAKLRNACLSYWGTVQKLSDKHRADTVFSRERELPGIFKKILKSHPWDVYGLGFYKYYLERHIELDSEEGDHGDLTEEFELHPAALAEFYKARLELYEALAPAE